MKRKVDPAITNFPSPIKPNGLTDDEKIEAIQEKFAGIMEVLGLDLEDESLKRTPYRVAKMYVKELFNGLQLDTFPEISFSESKFQKKGSTNIVFMSHSFNSFCEHHFVPMDGMAFVAYVPGKKLIGLSKIPRIVKYFSRRPQLQERLNAQIADSLSIVLDSEDVAVSLTAKHFCVICRGIESAHDVTTTNVLRGKFNTDTKLRDEFFEAIHRHNN